MVPRLVPEIEGGYPERDIGAEEGQGWGDSRRLIVQNLRLPKNDGTQDSFATVCTLDI